jgi:hypothetical protein
MVLLKRKRINITKKNKKLFPTEKSGTKENIDYIKGATYKIDYQYYKMHT